MTIALWLRPVAAELKVSGVDSPEKIIVFRAKIGEGHRLMISDHGREGIFPGEAEVRIARLPLDDEHGTRNNEAHRLNDLRVSSHWRADLFDTLENCLISGKVPSRIGVYFYDDDVKFRHSSDSKFEIVWHPIPNGTELFDIDFVFDFQ